MIEQHLSLRLAEKAEDDLASIWAHIASHATPDIADRMIAATMQACTPVLQFPSSGAARDHLAPGLRVVIRSPYALYYLHRQNEIIVVRVLHGARDADAMAAAGGFAT